MTISLQKAGEVVDLEPKIKGTQRSETPTIKPYRYDPRGDLKPLFDDYRESIPPSLEELTAHPDKMLLLIKKKLELIPATYTVIETHLHDYDVPGGKPLKTRMTRMATNLRKAAEESLKTVHVGMDKLGVPTSDADSTQDLNPSDGSDHDDHDHTGDFGSNGNATIIADSDFDRPTTAPVSIEEVEEIAFECIRLLDAVGSSKGIGADSLNVSVASRKSKGVASESNGVASNGGSLDDDDHDDPGVIPSKGLEKDGRVSFFLLAYIDVIIGWIVADVVGSHPSGDVLLDWGVLFRDHGVRPLPSFLYRKPSGRSEAVFLKYGRSTNTYYSFYRSFPMLHDSCRSDCLNWMLESNLYKKSNYLQQTVYRNYRTGKNGSRLKSRTTLDKNGIYAKLYDLMVDTVLLMRDSPQDLLEDPVVEVVVGEVINLWSFYDEYNSWRKTDQFTSIKDGIWRIVQRSQRATKSGDGGGYDSAVVVSSVDSQVKLSKIINSGGSGNGLNGNEISFLESVKSTRNANKGLEYDLLDFRTAYLDGWTEFVHGVYDVLRKSNYDRVALRAHVYGYDPKVVDKIFRSYKSSPIAKYSVNGRLVCLVRMYHLLVFATSKLPNFGGEITPKGVVSDSEFIELLKLYVTINTIVGDARFFMRKLSGDYDRYGVTNFDPDGPVGRYSSGLGYPAYCSWEESNPLGVVRRCGGVEWLDVKRIKRFVDFMEDESIDSFAAMPEDYVRETILMSIGE